jgi:hypothetical protein
MLKHIVTDDVGMTHFDHYFAHLESVRQSMPRALHAFASDESRYELQGTKTLHDAWIEGMSFRIDYQQANVIESARIDLDLRQALGGMVRMSYGGVSGWSFNGNPDRWPDRAVDLLVHEFDLAPNAMFVHRLAFDRGVSLEIVFRTFSFEETAS